MTKNKCLVIDPPCNQGKTGKRSTRPNQTTRLEYSMMPYEQLANLPIKDWADDDCFIWLWATNSKDKGTKEPILKSAFNLLED